MTERKPGRTAGRLLVETLVIALGVFLSLWADEWRADRARQAESRGALQRIAADLSTDTLRLRTHVFSSNRGVAAIDSVLNADPGRPETTTLIARLTPFIVGTYSFDAVSSQRNASSANQEYEALRSSGQLGLITSPQLLSDLAGYHAGIGYLQLLDQLDFEQNRVIARLMYPHIEFPRDRFANVADSAAFLPTPTVYPSVMRLLDERVFVNEMGQLGTLRTLSAATAARNLAAAADLLRAIEQELR